MISHGNLDVIKSLNIDINAILFIVAILGLVYVLIKYKYLIKFIRKLF